MKAKTKKKLFFLFLEQRGDFTHLTIPFFAEPSYQWLPQEAVEGHPLLAPQLHSRAADRPLVVVHGSIIGIFCQSYRVEMTGYRFLHRCPTLSVRGIDGTFADSVFIEVGEDTLLSVYDGGNQLTIGVCVGDPLF